jgi:hypothetical protein
MMSDTTESIIASEDCVCRSVRTPCVHHRDFPEIRGEGASPAEAAAHLADQLSRIIEHAPSDWRRQWIERAIEDARAFAARGHD